MPIHRMRNAGKLLAVLVLLATVLCGCGAPVIGDISSPVGFDDKLEAEIFRLINLERRRAGLQELVAVAKLNRVAREHNAYMVNRDVLSHRGRGGTLVEDRFDRHGIDWAQAGENVARNKGFESPVHEAVRGWMNSHGHRANILAPQYRETGIAVSKSEKSGYYYFTQVFLLRMPE